MSTIDVDVAIVGAGTAGLYALREVKRADKSFVLIDKGPLGTTCARVGCMPSKAALHAAEMWAVRTEQSTFGVEGTENLRLDRQAAWAKVRELRDGFASGAANNAIRSAGEHLLMGAARFVTPNQLSVETDDGQRTVNAKAVIIAAGSRPVMPGFLKPFADFCFTTDDLFDLTQLPQRLGVLGLGAIGLEMGLAMARLGVEVVGADMADTIGGIRDPEVAKLALKNFSKVFPMFLGSPAELEQAASGVTVKTKTESLNVDKVLVALGRRSNVDQLAIENLGVELDKRGLLPYNPETMQVANLPVYVVGDINGSRTLMHEAADEGAIAGFNAARLGAQAFQRKTPISIAFTQPDIISVGASFDSLNDDIIIGSANTSRNGRSRILSSDEGLLRIYIDKDNGLLLGASMIGPRAEHLAQYLSLAIESKLTAQQLLQAPYYHPVVEETVQSALQDALRQLPPSDFPFGLRPL